VRTILSSRVTAVTRLARWLQSTGIVGPSCSARRTPPKVLNPCAGIVDGQADKRMQCALVIARVVNIDAVAVLLELPELRDQRRPPSRGATRKRRSLRRYRAHAMGVAGSPN